MRPIVQPIALWDAIVNNDDICFEHILPKLNQTDVKFLYGVNRETRALVKRSSRKDELRRSFYVEEMSSISTLEIAWENRWSWSRWTFHEIQFCWKVVRTNKLELLKWIREEKKCDWDEWTISKAALQGNLEMVKYCVANKCPVNEYACAYAAEYGHLECLKYLHEEVKAQWNGVTALVAAGSGHLHILEYLVERKYDKFCEYSCLNAASAGHLDCLKYLHEIAKAPWDKYAVRSASICKETECVQYLLDNNCPLPDGWLYEEGVLHANLGDW